MSRRRSLDEVDSVSNRRGIFVGLMAVCGICVTTYLIFNRLSDDALSLVIGLSIGGALVGIPVALGLYSFLRFQSNLVERQRETRNGAPYIIQIPQQSPPQNALPDYGSMHWTVNNQTRKVQREWDTIGGDSE